MEEEIDFEHFESEILEIDKNVVLNKVLNFDLHNQPTGTSFQTKMTLNLKKMKTIQEVRYHKGNI